MATLNNYKSESAKNQQQIIRTKNNLFRASKEASSAEKEKSDLIKPTGTQSEINKLESAYQQRFSRLLRAEENPNEIDPYDSTPSSRKRKKNQDKVLQLTGQGYTNTLLERLIKTQDRQEYTNSVLKFQEQSIAYLTSINDEIKRLVELSTPKPQETKKLENRKEYQREASSMAKAIAELNVDKMATELRKGIVGKFDSMGTLGLLGSILGEIKDSITNKTFGAQVQSIIQQQIIKALPQRHQVQIDKFQTDPVMFVQDFINQGAHSKNAAIRTFAQMFAKHTEVDKSLRRDKIDLTATAKFDNKFYMAVTKLIPDYLAAITSAVEGREAKHFDWESQKYTGLSQMMAKEIQRTNGRSMTSVMNQTYRDISNAASDAMRRDRSGKLSSRIKKDQSGNVSYDQNGIIQMENSEAIRYTMRLIILSGINLDSIRTGRPKDILRTLKRADKNMTPEQEMDVYDTIDYLSLLFETMPPKELQDLEEGILSNREVLHQQFINPIFDFYNREELDALARAMQDNSTTKEQLQRMTKARYNTPAAGFIFGGGGIGKTVSSRDVGIGPIPKVYGGKDVFIQGMPQKRPLSLEEIQNRKNYLQKLANDEMYGYHPNQDLLDSKERATTKEQRKKMLWDDMVRTGNITKDQFDRWHNDPISEDTKREQKQALARYQQMLECYRVFKDAGFTAADMASRTGYKLQYWKSKGYPMGPEDFADCVHPDGTIFFEKLQAKNRKFTERYYESLKTYADNSNKDIQWDLSDPGRTMSQLTRELFKDPKIAKATGIGLGGVAGIGIGKLMQTMGVLKNPRAPLYLGAIGSGLMMMERYQKALQGVLGPDGDIKGKHGYSNKEILVAKIFQKWLPSIGMGGKAMSTTLNLFSKMGPVGMIAGIPISLIAGGIGAYVGPKLMKWVSNKLFADDGQGNKGIMKKIGGVLRHVPFFDKYWTASDTADHKTMTVQSLRKLLGRLQNRKLELLSQGYTEADEKVKALSLQIKQIGGKDGNGGAISDILSVSENLTEEAKMAEVNEIVDSLFTKITSDNTTGFLDGSVVQYRDAGNGDTLRGDFDQIFKDRVEEKNRKNDAGMIGDLKFTDHSETRKEKRDSLIKEMARTEYKIGPNGVWKRLQDISEEEAKEHPNVMEAIQKFKLMKSLHENDGNLRVTLEDSLEKFFTHNEDAREVLRDIYTGDSDSIKDTLRGHGVWEDFYTKVIRPKFANELERKKAYQMFLYGISDEKKRAEISEYFSKRMEGAKSARQVFDEMVHISMILAESNPSANTSPATLEKYALDELGTILRGRASWWTKLGKLIGVKGDLFGVGEKFLRFTNGVGDTTEETIESEQILDMLVNMEAGGKGKKGTRRSKGKRDASVRQYSDTLDGKLIKMDQLGDLTFRNGSSLSLAGCSIVAWNNCLVHLGLPTVGISTMVTIADKYLTQDGGVTSKFFLEMAERLGLKLQIYTRKENSFTLETLKQVAPSTGRGLIVLLENDYGGAHFITITKVKGKTCSVDDPERSGIVEVPTGTILAKSLEWITVSKSLQTTKTLTESGESTTFRDTVTNIWKKSKIGRATDRVVTGAQNAISLTKSATHAIRHPLAFAKSFFSKEKEDGTGVTPRQDRVETLLQKIIDRLSLSSGLPVMIVGNATESLDITDQAAAEEMLRYQTQDAKTEAEKGVLRRIKRFFRGPFMRRDRQQKDEAEKAMVDIRDQMMKNGLVAGTSSGMGGKGTNLDPGNGKSGGLLQTVMGTMIGTKLTTFLKGFLPGLAKFAIGSAVAAVAGYGLVKGVKGVWEATKSFFTRKEEKDATVDAQGNVLEASSYNDRSSDLMKIRDYGRISLGMGGLLAQQTEKTLRSSFISGLLKKVGATGAGQAAKQMTIQVGQSASGKGAFVLNVLNKIPGKLASIINSKTMQNVVMKIPGVGPAIASFLQNIVKFCKSIGPKVAQKAAQIGTKEGAKSTAKQIPVLGIALVTAGFVWSFWSGYRKAAKILNVSPDVMDQFPGTKVKIGLAKAFWENFADLLLSCMSTASMGLGTIGTISASAIFAIIRQVIGFQTFLSFLGINRDILQEQAKQKNLNLGYEAEKQKEVERQRVEAEQEEETGATPATESAGSSKSTDEEVNKVMAGATQHGIQEAHQNKVSLEHETKTKQKQQADAKGDMDLVASNLSGQVRQVMPTVDSKQAGTGITPRGNKTYAELYRESLMKGFFGKIASAITGGTMGSKVAHMDLSGIDFSKLSTKNMIFTKDPQKNKNAQVVADIILKYANEFDVDPTIALAQWAVESNWGTKQSGKNNFFGIKADGPPNQYWDGSSTEVWTKEHLGGHTGSYKLGFRNYKTLDDGIRDHLRLLRSKYPGTMKIGANALIHNPTTKASYATAPSYVASISRMQTQFRNAILKGGKDQGLEFALNGDPNSEAMKALSGKTQAVWSHARSNGLNHPMGDYKALITSTFGNRSMLPNFTGSKFHKGIDFAGKTGQVVYATSDGTVEQSQQEWGLIKINDSLKPGEASRYLHLSKRYVQAGDTVKAGQPIGEVGGIGLSGRTAYAPHLHYERIINGEKVDPFLALGLPPEAIKTTGNVAENLNYIRNNTWIQEMLDKKQRLQRANIIPVGLQDAKGGPEAVASTPNQPRPVSDTKAQLDSQRAKEQSAQTKLEQGAREQNQLKVLQANTEILASKLDKIVAVLQSILEGQTENTNNTLLRLVKNATI